MPKPGNGEKQKDFHQRCMKQMAGEGKSQDQSNAMCFSLWKNRESVEEGSLPMPRPTTNSIAPEPIQPREKQYEFLARCQREVKEKNATLSDEEATALCLYAWSTRWESVHPADAAIREASDEDWSKVDRKRLPRECFLWVEDREKKGTWHFPVYLGAGGIDPKTGLYREAGELNLQALAAAEAAARCGKMKIPASVTARLHSLVALYGEGHYEAYHTPVLQESADSPSHLVEDIDFSGAEFIEENGARIVKNVVMLGPESSHGYGYKQEAMAGAVQKGLYENCRIFINHSKEGRDLMQLAGIFKETRHEDGKVKGNAHLLDDEYGKKFWNIARTMPKAAGCSHVADGKLVKGEDGAQYVAEISKVYSVDLVVQGATTKNVFEGDEPQGEPTMEFKDLTVESLRQNRPDLVHKLVLEGAKTRDDEVQALMAEHQTIAKAKEALAAEKETLTADKTKLAEEKTRLQAKLDETAVLEATRQKEAVVAQALAELPEQARTETFKNICLNVTTGKDGFDAKVFEAKVAELVKDRKSLCEQTGVRGMGGEQNRGGSTKTAAEIAESALAEAR